MARECALSREGSCDGVRGSRKDDEEGVFLRVDLSSSRLGEGGAQQLLVCDVHLAVALAERSHESRRAFYVAEQECDSPGGQVPGLGGVRTHRDPAAMLGDCTVVVGTFASDDVAGGKLNAVTAPTIRAATKMERRRIILPSFSGMSPAPEDSRRRYDRRPRSSSGFSLRYGRFREIQEACRPEVWDDFLVPTTALIVDDHPSFRRFARKLLEAAGFQVVGDAEDGASALAAVDRLRPDVVLLDVLLPDTTGFVVAKQLAAGPERPLVVLTSSRSAADLGALVRTEHVRGFVSKRDLTVATLGALVSEPT
jgi:CheY-like chemotaxis protein